jgi:carboxyl-terminal processing protease
METLRKQGLQRLVFDLRGNGGGFMNEAVDMADEFLDGEKLVVYTEGMNSKRREYRCKRPGIFEKGDLVLLLDELSASASEVLAGALQDWCRATIIGRRTFGKGLVQEQYPLSDGGAIRLTIARYYTPLGRSIQRSYAKGRKIYMDELWERFNSGEMFSVDSLRNHNKGRSFLSHCKNDTLYGGDGITPLIFVAADSSLYGQKLNRWFTGNEMNKYVYQYYLAHIPELNTFKTATEYTQRFDAEKLWLGFIQSKDFNDQFRKSITQKEKELLRLRLKALLARFKWRNSGFYEVLNSEDPAIKIALGGGR